MEGESITGERGPNTHFWAMMVENRNQILEVDMTKKTSRSNEAKRYRKVRTDNRQ